MKLFANIGIGFVVTFMVLCGIAVALVLIAVPAYGIEMLAQKYIYPSDPSYVTPYNKNDGVAFGISYVVILMCVLGALAYAYTEREDS